MKYDPKKTGTVTVKQFGSGVLTLVYLLRDLRIVVTPDERRKMLQEVDPTKQGSFDLKSFQKVVEQKNKSIDLEQEMQKVFYIYD